MVENVKSNPENLKILFDFILSILTLGVSSWLKLKGKRKEIARLKSEIEKKKSGNA